MSRWHDRCGQRLRIRIKAPGLLLLSLMACGDFTPPQDENSQKESLPRKPELHGHRGARGLAPENTWPAFEAGILNRMTAIELDISLTADDDFIIHHDTFTNPQLCRHDNGGKIRATPIRRLKVAALKLLDCGSMRNAKFPEQKTAPFTRLITLNDFFAQLREMEKSDVRARQIMLNIDAKFAAAKNPTDADLRFFARTLVEKIQTAGLLSRTIVQSFETRLLPLVKALAPQVRTAALFQWSQWPGGGFKRRQNKRSHDALIAQARSAKANIIAPHMRDTDQKLVNLVHANGMEIIPWTVNEPDAMRQMFRLGVDGIISDYPDRLSAVADEFRK